MNNKRAPQKRGLSKNRLWTISLAARRAIIIETTEEQKDNYNDYNAPAVISITTAKTKTHYEFLLSDM